MTKKIAIIGSGNVGGALTRGLTKARREVKNVGDDKAAIRGAVEWADIVVLAVQHAVRSTWIAADSASSD